MRFIFLILFFVQMPAVAGVNPYCQDFNRIKSMMVKLDKGNVDRLLPKADWLDEKFRKKDRNKVVMIAGKTVVLALLKRLSFLSYVFEPTRAGVSSFTGYYVSSPENFARFLELQPRSACNYLSMGDSHADTLRELTHEVWISLDRAR
jgi:hypothetical protein